MTKHAVIVGAGLGGLECGYILAKNGLRVTVLEHDTQIGGCLQSFRRGNVLFDSGFHYVGGLGEGESLHGLMKYFDLLSLPWVRLDDDCFDEVVIGERSFPFASGYERFAQRLTEYFPSERDGIKKYVECLREVGEHLTDAFFERDLADFYADSFFARSAYDLLQSTITDPLLRRVLSATSLKMELNRDTLPFYVFAQINNSFLQSAWRISGGGQQIADRLEADILKMGGEVRTQATVSQIVETDGVATGVVLSSGELLQADYVICDIHPYEALQLLRDSRHIKKVYRHRIESLQNTFGMFTANIRLKPGSRLYQNRNIYVYPESSDLWDGAANTGQGVMVSFYYGQPALDLLTPMSWQQVERWRNTQAGRRGDDYVEMKQRVVERCLSRVEHRLPQLRDSIDRVFTSTPLTYYHYTLTHEGAAYGIRKDWRSPMTTVLTPKTPIPNVLLTGQNLNLHGVLGVSMTSVLTCAELIGIETLREQIRLSEW